MRYTTDADLLKKKSSILSLGIDDLSDFHIEAAKYAERDIADRWYRAASDELTKKWVKVASMQTAATFTGYPFVPRINSSYDYFREFPFNPRLLFSGFDYDSSETAAVTIGEKVIVLSSHIAGGVLGQTYQKIVSDLSETDLSGVDFSDTDVWSLETHINQLKDLVTYKTFYLLYQFMSGDHVKGDKDFASEQRDYWEKEYDKELDRLLKFGIDYDWSKNSVLDDEEKAIYPTGQRRAASIW